MSNDSKCEIPKPKYKIGDTVVVKTGYQAIIGGATCDHLGWLYTVDPNCDKRYLRESEILYRLLP